VPGEGERGRGAAQQQQPRVAGRAGVRPGSAGAAATPTPRPWPWVGPRERSPGPGGAKRLKGDAEGGTPHDVVIQGDAEGQASAPWRRRGGGRGWSQGGELSVS